MIYLGRCVSFSMAHRLNNPRLPAEQNRLLYGRCNNLNGHGHEYSLEVLVGGTVNPDTGFVVDLATLDGILDREVVERFDHRDFDRDFPEYANQISSGENLALLFWNLLAPALPAGTLLARIRLLETDRNSFTCYGPSALDVHAAAR